MNNQSLVNPSNTLARVHVNNNTLYYPFRSYNELKTLSILKLAVDSVNFGLCNYLDYFACSLLIAKNIYFDFSGRKLFISSVINSVILVSFAIIHGHIPSEFSD